MDYEDCVAFISVEELNENGEWQPVIEYTSWREDCALSAIGGIANKEPYESPASKMADFKKIANGTQRVTIRVGPSSNHGRDEETRMWIDQIRSQKHV